MPIKARDIEHIMKRRGIEAGSVYVMQMLAEEQSAQRQMIMECAQTIDTLAELATTAAIAVGQGPGVRKQQSSLTVAMTKAMGRDIDAPEVNMHDKHGDEGVITDPDKRAD